MKFMIQARINGIPMVMLIAAVMIFTAAQLASATPIIPPNYEAYYRNGEVQSMPADYAGYHSMQSTLDQLRQALDHFENTKRGIDLGLGRGFSGSQAAKHLMGLAAANFAGSPGRRRRAADAAAALSMRDELNV